MHFLFTGQNSHFNISYLLARHNMMSSESIFASRPLGLSLLPAFYCGRWVGTPQYDLESRLISLVPLTFSHRAQERPGTLVYQTQRFYLL